MRFFLKTQFGKGQQILLLVLSLLCVPALSASLQSNVENVLEPNRPVAQEIAEGQVHSINVRLVSKQFLLAEMVTWGLVADVTVYDHHNRVVTVVRSRCEGRTPISVIALVGGTYRLKIHATMGGGRYEIKIDELRPSTTSDNGRVAAEKLYAEAERLKAEETAESIRSAIKKYEEAATISRAVPDPREEASARNRIGDLHQILSGSKAFNYYQQALEISRRAQDKSGIAEALNNLGYLHFFLGHTQQAMDAAQEALKYSREAGNRRTEAQSLSIIGETHYGFGDMARALEFQDQALSLWRDLKDWRGQAQSLVASGYAYGQMSESRKALDSFNDALALWKAVKCSRGQALTLIALGNIQNKLGEKQEALNLYLQAKRLLDPVGETSYKAYVYAHLARLYRDMGENKLALDHNNQAVELFRASGNRWGEAEGLLGIGRIYNTLEEYRTALNYYLDALETFRSLGMPRLQAQTLRDIGKTYDALGDGVAALNYYQRALEIIRVGQDQREKAQALNYVGGVYERLEDKVKARDYYTQALTLSRSVRDLQGESSSLYNLAHLDRACGELDAAREKLESAIELSEALRSKVARQDLRASFLASAHRQYELYVDVLMKLHEKDPLKRYNITALEVSERGRARSLLESLAEARAGIRQGIDEQLLRRERELQEQINAKVEQRIQLAAKSSAKQIAIVERDLNELTDEYRSLEAEIKVASPRYAALTQPVPLTLAEMQRVLDADTVLLVYGLGEGRSFLWMVESTSIKSFELPARVEIEKPSRRVYELLTAHNREVKEETPSQEQARIRRAEDEYVEAAAMLGRMLLNPVASELGRKRIVVVADGALQYVPFAALPVPARNAVANSAFVPLIAEHEVVSLPSVSVLASIREELRRRQPAPELIAVLADPVFDRRDDRLAAVKKRDAGESGRTHFGAGSNMVAAARVRQGLRNFEGWTKGQGIPRLPFSTREADAIKAAAPANGVMLALGFRANRATASSPELAKYRIVHFATHGIIDSEHPEFSGILLSRFDEAGTYQEGFFLQLREIYNLNLPAELIVLSACQTALGKDIRGEGLVGLTRGFMYAGAARVIASLWRVDDAATAELMGEFYRAMFNEGQTSARALQTAQLRMWQKPRWSNPYYWAAFTLQGEWR